MKFKNIVLKQMFQGFPKKEDFEFVEVDVSEKLQQGEFIYEALYISVDPYLRAFAGSLYTVGDTVAGYQLSRVVKSRNEKYPCGTVLAIGSGWRSGGKSNGDDVWYIRNDIPSEMSQSAGIGILGMAGMTAYQGIKTICKPKQGETLLINCSAGSVGVAAVQIAKTMGCRVIGSCGSDEKLKFARSVGYDDVFNYKTESVESALKRMAPDGIDCFFDSVGGQYTSTVIRHMNKFGRIAVCGAISTYNAEEPVQADVVQLDIAAKSLLMQGIFVFEMKNEYQEVYDFLKSLVKQGKLKSYEVITDGFGNLPSAFIDLLRGKNCGKMLVKV